jgi:hypothetical protein
MTDFKNNIRKKYNQEVQPKTPIDGWNKFESYRNARKNRKKRFLWFLIPFGFLIVASLYWNIQSGYKISESFEKNTTLIDEINNPQATGQVRDDKLQNEGQEKFQIPNNKIVDIQSSQHVVETRQTTSRMKMPNKALVKNPATESLPFTISNEILTTHSNPIKEKQTPSIKKPLQLNPLAYINKPLVKIDYSHKEIFLDKKTSLFEKDNSYILRPAMMFFVGAGFPKSANTFEETAFQIGLAYAYPIGGKWSIRTDLSLHNINYQANIMSPSLGLRTIGAPKAGQVFTKAEVESNSFQLGMGLSYIVLQKRKWNINLGMAYHIAREFLKDSDYFFADNSPNPLEDIITLHNKDTYFITNMLRPELGFNYQLPGASFTMRLGYTWQLNSTKYNMQDQVQLNLGIRKQF